MGHVPDLERMETRATRGTLTEAERLCRQRGVRFTALRRRVLEIICCRRSPQGAYDILDVLRQDGRRGAPPTVYRALDFLIAQGLIHRLASLNAFIRCHSPGEQHVGQFLICESCGDVSELNSATLADNVRDEADRRSFSVQSQIVEILGRCGACAKGGASNGG